MSILEQSALTFLFNTEPGLLDKVSQNLSEIPFPQCNQCVEAPNRTMSPASASGHHDQKQSPSKTKSSRCIINKSPSPKSSTQCLDSPLSSSRDQFKMRSHLGMRPAYRGIIEKDSCPGISNDFCDGPIGTSCYPSQDRHPSSAKPLLSGIHKNAPFENSSNGFMDPPIGVSCDPCTLRTPRHPRACHSPSHRGMLNESRGSPRSKWEKSEKIRPGTKELEQFKVTVYEERRLNVEQARGARRLRTKLKSSKFEWDPQWLMLDSCCP